MRNYFQSISAAVLVFLAAGCFPAAAQNFTYVQANKIQDASGALLASGQHCAQGVTSLGVPISYQAGGGGLVYRKPVCVNVTNGAIPFLQLANSAATSPLNVAYLFTVTDNNTGDVILSVGPTQVTGSGWSLDNYQPNLAPLAIIQTGPQGPPGPAAVVTSNGSNGDFAVGGNLTYAKLDGMPSMSALSPRFGAKGDGLTDDTNAIQACITWSQSNRGICYLPPAIYRIASGLTITGQAVLRGDSPLANGIAQLRYTGTGDPLTIGTDSALVYGVTLQNIMIVAENGVSARYGINIQGLSEAHWTGVIIGGATSGQFQAGVRFYDSSGIAVDGLLVTNQDGVLGSTAVLFAEGGNLFNNNSNISIEHADMYMQNTMFDVRSCDHCRVFNALNLEAFDYLVNLDNSANTLTNYNTFAVKDSSITANAASYFSHRKLLNINVASGKRANLYLVDFEGNRAILAGGVTNPLQLTVASGNTGGYLNLQVKNNTFIGANGALTGVSSPNALAHLYYGFNHVFAADGATRTPDVVPYALGSSAYYVHEEVPINSGNQQLAWTDINGTRYMAGSSGPSMARPSAGAPVPGAIYGSDQSTPLNTNGFIRVGTAGGLNPVYAVYCDWSGASSVTDLNRNMACFIGGTEIFRLDGSQVKVSNVPFSAPSVTATSGFTAGSLSGLSLTCSGAQTAKPKAITGGLVTAAICQ